MMAKLSKEILLWKSKYNTIDVFGIEKWLINPVSRMHTVVSMTIDQLNR